MWKIGLNPAVFLLKTKNLNWLIVPEEGLEPPTCGL